MRAKISVKWGEVLANDEVRSRYQTVLAYRLTEQDKEGSIETIWAGLRASIDETARVAVETRSRTRLERHEARLKT